MIFIVAVSSYKQSSLCVLASWREKKITERSLEEEGSREDGALAKEGAIAHNGHVRSSMNTRGEAG
jgi:hypothetical protein